MILAGAVVGSAPEQISAGCIANTIYFRRSSGGFRARKQTGHFTEPEAQLSDKSGLETCSVLKPEPDKRLARKFRMRGKTRNTTATITSMTGIAIHSHLRDDFGLFIINPFTTQRRHLFTRQSPCIMQENDHTR
jgi:hypothetical protein